MLMKLHRQSELRRGVFPIALQIRDHLTEKTNVVLNGAQGFIAPIAKPTTEVAALVTMIEDDPVMLQVFVVAGADIANSRPRPAGYDVLCHQVFLSSCLLVGLFLVLVLSPPGFVIVAMFGIPHAHIGKTSFSVPFWHSLWSSHQDHGSGAVSVRTH